MVALFLSDLHLPAEPSPLREGFLRFLAGPAREASAVYLLGDIFEYWIGDDVGLEAYAAEAQALHALTRAGVDVHFMHGNRDFLVGRRFARATGVRLLRDPVRIELGGAPVLLSHGDLWCTDDLAYQRWRRFSRNGLAQAIYALLPRWLRLRIAGDVRQRSQRDKGGKSDMIMDVNPQAVAAAFAETRAHTIIHGHTHRPAEHRLSIAGRTVRRIVLADWHADRMEYLFAGAGSLERRTVPG